MVLGREKGRSRVMGLQSVCIGISGLSRGCGTTHLSIMMAKYLSVCQGYQTAYIELDRNVQMVRFGELLDVKDPERGFRYQGIYFYPAASHQKIHGARTDGCRAVVLDLGLEQQVPEAVKESCTMRYMIVDGAVWKQAVFTDWLSRNEKQTDQNLRILMSTSGEKRSKRLDRTSGIVLDAVPYLPDPFGIKPPVIQWMNQLIGTIR